MTNPIRKRPRSACLSINWAPPRKRWYAICPDCSEDVEVGEYDISTRKTAKDALHRHHRKKHTQPRSG